MATPPCFCQQNCICKSKIPREGEAGIVAQYFKEVGVTFFRDVPHIAHNLQACAIPVQLLFYSYVTSLPR